jgi:membrane protein YqaA with SNARE-associated domain
MKLAAALRTVNLSTMKYLAALAPQAAAVSRRPRSPLMHVFLSFGLFGVFPISIVDSSFVPLPLPGITDVMIIIMAAQHQNVILLVLLATAGSALGGYFSHLVGQRGGMAFLEKRVPARIFKRVCRWMESHAILSVALPAILPPPMPLSPFVLAAGALRMSRKKFMIAFTVSRCLRHTIAAWLGIHYGRHIIRLWNSLSAKYATPVLIVLWVGIAMSCAFAFWQLYKTSRKVGVRTGSLVDRPNPTA